MTPSPFGVILDHVQRGKFMKLKVILEPSEDSGYTVYIPSLPGCISEGETVEEALLNIREAAELYLESADDDHLLQENSIIKELVV